MFLIFVISSTSHRLDGICQPGWDNYRNSYIYCSKPSVNVVKKIFYLLYLFSAIIFVVAFYTEKDILASVSKPIPLLLLIIHVKRTSVYNNLIFTAFIFSLVGDILLMKTVNLLLYGLISFLAAHLFYITAFILNSNKKAWVSCLPFYLYGILIFLFLRTSLESETIPIAIYIVIISTMLWRAYVQRKSGSMSIWAFWGAIFFTISDTMIAIYQFYKPFFLDHFFTIATYWLAQFLIYTSTKQKTLN